MTDSDPNLSFFINSKPERDLFHLYHNFANKHKAIFIGKNDIINFFYSFIDRLTDHPVASLPECKGKK